MSQTIGEIRMFAGDFEPRGWFLCDGRLLPIRLYTSLFIVMGTTYGGDGVNTFALPDLRRRVPVGIGNGVGLSNVSWGSKFGVQYVELYNREIPTHSHAVDKDNMTINNSLVSNQLSTIHQPTNGKSLGVATNKGVSTLGYNQEEPNTTLHGSTLKNEDLSKTTTVVGGGQPHNNMQPFLCINYIIAIEGYFPSYS